MSQEQRVTKLEQSVPKAVPGDLPVLVVHWPEHETEATRAEARRVRRVWAQAGVKLADADVVVNWGSNESETEG